MSTKKALPVNSTDAESNLTAKRASRSISKTKTCKMTNVSASDIRENHPQAKHVRAQSKQNTVPSPVLMQTPLLPDAQPKSTVKRVSRSKSRTSSLQKQARPTTSSRVQIKKQDIVKSRSPDSRPELPPKPKYLAMHNSKQKVHAEGSSSIIIPVDLNLIDAVEEPASVSNEQINTEGPSSIIIPVDLNLVDVVEEPASVYNQQIHTEGPSSIIIPLDLNLDNVVEEPASVSNEQINTEGPPVLLFLLIRI